MRAGVLQIVLIVAAGWTGLALLAVPFVVRLGRGEAEAERVHAEFASELLADAPADVERPRQTSHA